MSGLRNFAPDHSLVTLVNPAGLATSPYRESSMRRIAACCRRCRPGAMTLIFFLESLDWANTFPQSLLNTDNSELKLQDLIIY